MEDTYCSISGYGLTTVIISTHTEEKMQDRKKVCAKQDRVTGHLIGDGKKKCKHLSVPLRSDSSKNNSAPHRKHSFNQTTAHLFHTIHHANQTSAIKEHVAKPL